MKFRDIATTHMPIWLYSLVGLGLVGQGFRYLVTAEIAPYHIAVIETPWENISPSYQQLLLGLYRGFGAGFLCVGLAIIVLALVPFRSGHQWARWATPALAATYTAALIYITSSALLPGAKPIAVSTVLFGLVVVAALLSSIGESGIKC